MMLSNHSFHIESSGFSSTRPSGQRQATSVFSKCKTTFHKSLSSGFLHTAVVVYRQNPLLATVVGGFSLISLILVVIVFALAGGKTNTPYGQYDGFSDADAAFGGQYTTARIKYDLNRIALSIIEGDGWDKQNIDHFSFAWNALDALEKTKVKQTVWFQSLENALLNKPRSNANGERGKLLADLSDQLGLQRSVSEPSIAKRAESSHRKLPPVVKAEASQPQAPKTPVVKAQPVKSNPAPTQTAKAELQKPQQAVTPPTQRVEIAVANDNRIQSQAVLTASNKAPAVSSSPTSRLTNPGKSQPRFSALSAKTVQQKRINRVIRTPQPVDAKQLPATSGQPSVASAPSSLVKSSSPSQAASTSNTINESELKKITTEFVSSYENGNIISFTSLFAPKAVSNDDADLDTIKKEYSSLFATTSDRRMIIGDIKWDLSNNTATGEGQLEVAVKSRGAKDAQVYSGKIQIVVEKQVDGVQITELYHILQ